MTPTNDPLAPLPCDCYHEGACRESECGHPEWTHTPTNPDPLGVGGCAYRCPLSVEGHHNRHDCDHAYQVAAIYPNAGSHGDGVNDSHYDPGCGRCIEQRDQTRPDVPWDTIYAEVES